MKFIKLPLDGSFRIELEPIGDDRGFFSRYWCYDQFQELGLDNSIAQINTSYSANKGTLRGLHFQFPPKSETKIVRCLKGAIWDVIVDIRNNSSTFGNWYGLELNEKNRSMLYIPKGFAHGFQTLENNTELIYIHSEFYSPEYEGGLNYKDNQLNIPWPLEITDISERDLQHPDLNGIVPIKI